MKFNASDLKAIPIEYNFYLLCFDDKFISFEEAKTFMLKINATMRRLLKNTAASYLLGVSEIEGQKAVRQTLRQPKTGRPPAIIIGNKVMPHIHGVLYGEKAATHALSVTRRINRNEKRTIVKTYKAADSGYVPYILNQCRCIRTFGEFDFIQLRDSMYYEVK